MFPPEQVHIQVAYLCSWYERENFLQLTMYFFMIFHIVLVNLVNNKIITLEVTLFCFLLLFP